MPIPYIRHTSFFCTLLASHRSIRMANKIKWDKKRKPPTKIAGDLPVVEYSGLEPLTSTLPVSRSSQMS